MHKITSVKSHKMWVVIVSGMGIMGVGGGIGGSNSVCILMFLNWVSPHFFHHNANGGGSVQIIGPFQLSKSVYAK